MLTLIHHNANNVLLNNNNWTGLSRTSLYQCQESAVTAKSKFGRKTSIEIFERYHPESHRPLFAMDSRRVAALLMVISMVLFSLDKAEAASKHCTWHGTAPICLPSCPHDKQVIKESACGKAKLACCITGTKKLCCPKSLGNIDPALAEAMAD
ncbi:hypothetical protein RvY_02070 [Ramazzottius varieornatus]|uniref:Uncharacterized protein n=1 Tax=Ramazzottius varieornatus TaxID=947166 RepID=A0A1D1UQI0_RAMVA|nr:hypothetical protein RvY_02070 [Ramazzottius varieornatus]